MTKEDVKQLIYAYIHDLKKCNVDPNIVVRNTAILEDFYYTKVEPFKG